MNTPDQYNRCLRKLETDYNERGVVDLLHCTNTTRDQFEEALRANPHPISWEEILKQLKVNNWALLRLAARIPGNGTNVELVGADAAGGVAIRSTFNLKGDLHTFQSLDHVNKEKKGGGWIRVLPTWESVRLLAPDELHTRKGAATPLQIASLVEAEGWSLASPVKRKGEYVDKYDTNCGLIAAYEAVTQRPYSRNPGETYGSTLVVPEEYKDADHIYLELITGDSKKPESSSLSRYCSTNPEPYLRAAPWAKNRSYSR